MQTSQAQTKNNPKILRERERERSISSNYQKKKKKISVGTKAAGWNSNPIRIVQKFVGLGSGLGWVG